MVHCTKCGTKNEETAVYCFKCGAKLEVPKEETWDKRMEKWGEDFGKRAEKWGEDVGKRAEEWGENFGKRAEKECFGLPHGGLIFGLLIGLIIILVGVSSLLTGSEVTRYFWPLLVTIFGLLITVGSLYSLTRKR
ncbi:MAG: zinc ribbon domain-containing protein [Candidatus Bathyarchaeum sp.]|nr:MAG: zinc ribbon domain-containing protein [Candidatus Bathyarchaeum sp.]